MYIAWKAQREEEDEKEEFGEENIMAVPMPRRERESRYRRFILLGTDGSVHSDFALKYFHENVYKDGDYIFLLYCPKMADLGNLVDQGKGDVVVKLGKLVLDENQRFVDDARLIEETLTERKLDGEVQIGVSGIAPEEAIIQTANKEQASMVVMGARRLGQGLRKETGSTKQFVVQNSHIPVLICKHATKVETTPKRPKVKRIVVAGSDGGLRANAALKYYKDNIFRDGDFLITAYIPKPRKTIPPTTKNAVTACGEPDLKKEAESLYADDAALLKEKLDDLKIPGEVVIAALNSHPGQTILDIAKKEHAGLIVVGSRGAGAATYKDGVVSTSDYIVNNSTLSVFVYKC